MKKKGIIVGLLCVLCCCVCLVSFGCTPDPTPPPPDDRMVITPAELTLEQYEDATLTVSGAGETVAWSSSDPQKVSVENGVVVALQTGVVTITASSGDQSATCTVTVTESSYVPLLSLVQTSEELDLLIGDTFTLRPTVTYRGEEVTGATYRFSADSEYFTVSEDGIVTAKTIGSGVITIEAEWRGCQSDSMKLNLTVNVKANLSINLDKDSLQLYTSDVAGNATEDSVLPTVLMEGSPMPEQPAVEWVKDLQEGDTDNIVTVEGNTFSAISAGIIHYYARCNIEGTEVRTDPIMIKVEIPVVDKTASISLDISKHSTDWEKLDGIYDGTLTAEQLGVTGKITRVEHSDGSEITIVEAGNNAKPADFSALRTGEQKWQIYVDDKVAYLVNVTVITKVISTPEEFRDLYYGNLDSAGTYDESAKIYAELQKEGNFSAWTGYFIVDRDIDGTGVTITRISQYNLTTGWNGQVGGNVGFRGTFDGRGHTLSNFTTHETGGASAGVGGGLWGYIGDDAIIRNVAITNIKSDGINDGRAWFANVIFKATIENVYLSTAYNYTLGVEISMGATYKNVVVVTPTAEYVPFDNAPVENPSCQNVYVFANTNANPLFTDLDGVNYFVYNSYQTDPAFTEIDFASIFDTSEQGYWTIPENGIPIMKSSQEEMIL